MPPVYVDDDEVDDNIVTFMITSFEHHSLSIVMDNVDTR